MKNRKYIRFNSTWWNLMRALSIDLRDEIFRAICSFAIDGQEPELSDMAAGMFASIRIELSEQIEHDDQVKAARSKAGRMRAAKTNEIRWGSRQISSNDDTYRQMTTNDDKKSSNDDKNAKNSSVLSSNDDTYRQMTTNPPAPPNIYNYILTHSHNAHARGFETVLGWLVDDTERLKLEFYRLQLIASTDDEECARVILPYIDAYFEQNDFSADWDQKGRKDTKAHFSSWVRKHKNLEENGTKTEAKPTGKQRTTALDAYNAALLGISLADAERSDQEK